MSKPEPKEAYAAHEIGALRDRCDTLERQVLRLYVLQRISQEVVSELDHERLLHNILRSAVEVMEASAGSLILLDEITDELVFRVVEGGGGEKLHNQRMPRHTMPRSMPALIIRPCP
jgi:hypothetical protein